MPGNLKLLLLVGSSPLAQPCMWAVYACRQSYRARTLTGRSIPCHKRGQADTPYKKSQKRDWRQLRMYPRRKEALPTRPRGSTSQASTPRTQSSCVQADRSHRCMEYTRYYECRPQSSQAHTPVAAPHRPRMRSPAGSRSIRAGLSRLTRCRMSLARTSAAARVRSREGRRSPLSTTCTTTRPSRSDTSMLGTARKLRSRLLPHGCPARTVMTRSSQSSKRGPVCTRCIDWQW